MSGALTARIGRTQNDGWSISEGTDGVYTTGFQSGSFGSISKTTTFGQANITRITMTRTEIKGTWTYTFIIRMSGDLASSFWTSVVIDGHGTINSSSMSRSYIGPDTEWSLVGTNITGINGSGTTTGRFI